MPTTRTCYTCEKPGITREHAPPRVLFPEGYRKNLITVRSCEKHNRDKSIDDEIFAHNVASAPGGNELALLVVDTILRSWNERPHLRATFLPHVQPIMGHDGPTISFRTDRVRFDSSVRALVRALYYKEYRNKLHADIEVVWAVFRTRDRKHMPFIHSTAALEKKLGPATKGSEPRVFAYDFQEGVDKKRRRPVFYCRMRFFEGIPIIALWRPGKGAVMGG